ncbi:FecR domain-containing protein [Muricauda sp. SCSIO 64092]|uniref:FecR family protein n=1 Tax=Allomuricauda sp. SCSIO 64092 TaxID=2908842 RepID=UPI001FF6A394|nr:FecR domain-containing protein [Muricauda sp. SCSIO 64092]UOY06534.1 FecR domain-containing protein [Muricauda sp. SCSIO 64092]
MFEEKDDTIMARWLSGELTEAERTEFEASSEYEEYQRLAKGLKAFKKPDFDKEALRERTWKEIENQKPVKVIRLRGFYYAVGIAASILVLFGLFFSKVTYTTTVGEKITVALPDGTKVSLNAQSKLSHRRFFWMDNKVVSLNGEGFFKVTKGEGFSVNTESGTINVLGTEFNVKARPSSFELYCYEGEVRYENDIEQQEAYLSAGDAVQLKGKILLEFKHGDTRPLWQNGMSRFSNTELPIVMKELGTYYDISFDFTPGMIQGHFTGTFVHDDLEIALKSVFVPMGITYELSKDKKTVFLHVHERQ